jgi:hypothetical protein
MYLLNTPRPLSSMIVKTDLCALPIFAVLCLRLRTNLVARLVKLLRRVRGLAHGILVARSQ